MASGEAPFTRGVTMAAVGGKQNIVALEVRADPGGHRLLTDGWMQGSGHQALRERFQRRLLEGAHLAHAAVMAEKPRPVDVGWNLWRRTHDLPPEGSAKRRL